VGEGGIDVLIQKDKREQKKYPNPWQEDERVKVTIFPNEHMAQGKRGDARIEINGYVGHVPVGQEVEVPRSVLEQLKNQKSVITNSPGGMATPHRVDTARGGDRSDGANDARYVSDWHIMER
jgi:hypothetical protein